MAKYDSKHLPELLKERDTVTILPGHTLTVRSNFIEDSDHPNRWTINKLLGLERTDNEGEYVHELFFAVTGVKSESDWPEPNCVSGDSLKLQTQFVLFLFKLAKLKTTKARQAAAAAKIAELTKAKEAAIKTFSPEARLIAKYFNANRDAFGCQRGHVIALLSVLTHSKINLAIDNVEAD